MMTAFWALLALLVCVLIGWGTRELDLSREIDRLETELADESARRDAQNGRNGNLHAVNVTELKLADKYRDEVFRQRAIIREQEARINDLEIRVARSFQAVPPARTYDQSKARHPSRRVVDIRDGNREAK